MTVGQIEINQAELMQFCRSNAIRRLALFGSVLTGRFSDTSDVDVLVEFKPGEPVGYLRMAALERELSRLFGGRQGGSANAEGIEPVLSRRSPANGCCSVC